MGTCHGHLPSTSTRIRSGAAAATDLQYPLKGVHDAGMRHSILWKTGGTGLQISSVAQSYQTLCNPMDCSTPGFPALHYLPEFAQTHVHWVNGVIQPSLPLSSPLLLPSIFPSIRVFSNESALCIRWPKYWSFSFSICPWGYHLELMLSHATQIPQQN